MTYAERWEKIEAEINKLYEVHTTLFDLKAYKEMKQASKLIDALQKIVEECR